MGGSAPQTPWDLALFSSRVDDFSLVYISDRRTMERLDRRIGQRRDATRAPTQARSGWRPSGRLLVSHGDQALTVPGAADARNWFQEK
jgi:hypothetical protein